MRQFIIGVANNVPGVANDWEELDVALREMGFVIPNRPAEQATDKYGLDTTSSLKAELKSANETIAKLQASCDSWRALVDEAQKEWAAAVSRRDWYERAAIEFEGRCNGIRDILDATKYVYKDND